MTREKYDAQKEHEVVGMYPGIKGLELGAAEGLKITMVPETPRFYRPIAPRDNYHMLLREHKTPYWVPYNGWVMCDVNEFRPRQHPDNVANHQCMDGGEFVDYEAIGMVQKGWFNMPLEWEPNCMGATVRPGSDLMPTLDNWESLDWPDLDKVDWEEMREMNKGYLDVDKANQLGIQLTIWERLMCLMGVDNAAVALLDEDQEDDLHAFLDRLSDLLVDYIRRVSGIGRIDSVMLHDDWGTQNAPFFSLEVAREVFVPPMKKIVDFCHANDIVVEHHCCGNATPLVPAMLEVGSDYWCPQLGCNDVDKLIAEYGDADFAFSVYSPTLEECQSVEEARECGYKWFEKYEGKKVLLQQNCFNFEYYQAFTDAVYEASRKAYQTIED